jgi:hypothetical protein
VETTFDTSSTVLGNTTKLGTIPSIEYDALFSVGSVLETPTLFSD